MLLTGIKTPIIINVEEKKPDKNIEKIQVFLNDINNQKFEEAIELIDIETINKYKKIKLSKNDYINSLDNDVSRKFIKYKINTIKKKENKSTLYGIISKRILKKDDINYEIYTVEGEIPDYNIYGTYILNNMFKNYYCIIN